MGNSTKNSDKLHSVTVIDFNGNRYSLAYPEKPNIKYRGTKPIQSSSGFYDGGPDASYNFKSQQQAEELLKLFELVLGDEENYTKDRIVSCWTFIGEDGSKVYIDRGQKLEMFVKKLKQVCKK